MSANCKSCGRIMTKPEDYSDGNIESPYCSSCTNADGSLKSLDEITLHIANQLIMSQGIDREAATKAARSILSVQPEWRTRMGNSDKTHKNKLILALTALILVTVIVTTLLIVNPKRNRYYIEPFYAYYLDDNFNRLGFSKLTNDTNVTTVDGIKITQIPFEYDQTEVNFAQNGNLEFTIDNNTDVKYSIVDFNFRYTQPAGFLAEPLSYEMNSKDGYIGKIGNKTFWLTDNHDKTAIKEVSDESSGIKVLGCPFDENVVLCGTMLAWLERSPDNHFITSVMAYNTETGKVFVVDKSDTAKFSLAGGKSCIYWGDSVNPYDDRTMVKGYDFKKKKPVKTDIWIYSTEYKYSPATRLQKMMQENQKSVSLWQVVGDGIVYQNTGNNNRLAYFNSDLDNHLLIDKASYSPTFLATYWRDPDSMVPSSNGYTVTYSVQHKLLADRSIEDKNKYLAWQKLNKDQSFSIQYAKLDDVANVKTIDSDINPILITGNWLVCFQDKSDNSDSRATQIIIKNLGSGQEINLGSYKIGPSWSISGQNGMLAWSAWNKDTGYDIFYTKLP